MTVPEWAEKAVSISTIYASLRPPVSRAAEDQVHIPLLLGGVLTLYRDDSLRDPDSFYAMVRDSDGRTLQKMDTLSGPGALQTYLHEYEKGRKNATSTR